MAEETVVQPKEKKPQVAATPAAEKNGKEQNRSNNKQQGKKKVDIKLLREQKRQQRVTRAAEDDVEVVSRKTADAGDMVMLLSSLDWGMEKVRKQMGRNPNIPIGIAAELIDECQDLASRVNNLNTKIFGLLGARYEPPRRYRKQDAEVAVAA